MVFTIRKASVLNILNVETPLKELQLKYYCELLYHKIMHHQIINNRLHRSNTIQQVNKTNGTVVCVVYYSILIACFMILLFIMFYIILHFGFCYFIYLSMYTSSAIYSLLIYYLCTYYCVFCTLSACC